MVDTEFADSYIETDTILEALIGADPRAAAVALKALAAASQEWYCQEATRRIRYSDAGKDVPIVAITSFAMTGDKERLLAAGCTGYIEKPINPETIMGDIAAFLEENR